jgi:hypothetical protein
MINDHLELFEMILDSLEKEYPSQTPDESIAMDRLASIASLGAIDYMTELEETVSHLRRTVKRLSKES